MKTMKAVVLRAHGGPENLVLGDIAKPDVTPGRVLIKVKATSVNPVDYKLRSHAMPFSQNFPAVLHGDVAGIIEAVGAGVTGFKVGDHVYGCAGGVANTEGGALAEFMIADPDLLAIKPKSLSFAEAAALPLVTLTAWEALIDKGQVKSGNAVLIHGATGGVGHIAIQLARAAGATVYATVGSESKIAVAKELGAHEVINYKIEDVSTYVERLTQGRGFDFVFDTIGGDNFAKSIEATRHNGQLATIAVMGQADITSISLKGITWHAVLMLIPMLTGIDRAHHGEILRKAAGLVDAGHLKPLLDSQQFVLQNAGAAHKHLESGKAIGKVVITND